jgi:hypothetical protein
MSFSHFVRWTFVVAIAGATGATVAACGGGGSTHDSAGVNFDASSDATGGLLSLDGGSGSRCTPKTCSQAGFTCGMNGDGCGGTLDCGSCTAPQYCGGGGYSKCGGGTPVGADGGTVPVCTPFTCATAPNGPYNCGQTGDGCGGIINCGSCSADQFCGGGGFNQCGGSTGLQADGSVPCTPATACPTGQNCGQAADGCGGLIACGSCTSPAYCGGGGPSICGGNDGLSADGSVPCTPATTCSGGQNCGQAADGCGGLIDCGTCTSPAYCGGGAPNVCGGNNGLNPDGALLCTATTCAALGNPCGQQSDGCGGVLNCTQCVLPQTCGGGGVPNQCGGNNGVGPDGGLLCTARTCATFPAGTCGQQADGCGGTTVSCGSCAVPDTCGGGGVPSQCGNSKLTADGGNPCTPATSCPIGVTCGQAADGCGGLIPCGSCALPDICGGGGVPGQCGNSQLLPDGGIPCTPTSCSKLGYTCGPAGDGCGNQLNCGTCTNPQYCGANNVYDKCGGNNGLNPDGSVACTPTTCVKLGYTCGYADDGCGNVLNCGGNTACTAPQYCGGGGYDVCGPSSLSPCPDGGVTSLTGYVYDPADNLPIYNALVYVPIDPSNIATPTTGINTTSPVCGCSAPAAYASGYTDITGLFTLTNVPSGSTKVVVQLGKWQRVFTQTIVACQQNTATNGDAGSHLTLPSTHLQGNIPLFAVDTGGVDSMECVLSKMGIATSEFTDPVIVNGKPTGAGRVHFYEGSIVRGGAIIDTNTPTESALTETASVMDSYDVILFPCQGGAGSYTSAKGWPNTLGNLTTYANDGGRVFATHFHYDLIEGNGTGNGSFGGTATWNGNPQNYGTVYGDPTYNTDINTGFTTGATLASWLNQASVYGGTYGVMPVGVIRTDVASVVSPAETWLSTPTCSGNGATCTTGATCCSGSCTGGRTKTCTNPSNADLPSNIPIHYTFDTPFNQSPSCGRVVYSDFHVESQPASTTYFTGDTFPTECEGGATGTMTAQEKLLEFMLFDLTSCVSPPSCTPLTCASFPGTCGVQGDGCGGQTANCGTCAAPQTCGGGGVPNQCGYPDAGSCTGKTCSQLSIGCGPAGDGCGNVIQCGGCTAPATCGGGGVAGQCGYPDAGCTPLTCASYASTKCGEQSDGCGGHTAYCNPCTTPATCGGGGVAGQCGYPSPTCTPSTCSSLALQCGYGSDGCGGVTADCGICPAGSSCKNNMCVAVDAGSACVPSNCSQLSIQCGQTDDGCGNLLTCASCPSGQTCQFNVCVSPDGGACTPLTCSNFPSTTCGEQGDGCGGHTANCNPCTPPATCGGGGTPNQCGYPDSGACTPLTCAAFPSTACGPQADGCGGVTAFCNPCTAPATCGGGGVADQCGYPDAGSCVPQTCQQQNIGCGPAGDGCGNVIQCGNCTTPQTCGGGGVSSQCGTPDAGACVPLTCASQHVNCGPIGDGCGNLLQCGTCSGNQTCGGGGTPGQCGGGNLQ